ncbi:MAG TPA: glycosyltransferase family 4 protein [Vicinamibacteria bacterium]|nr:glycosyltransferase family 4 protein [Vicinamibacteria bacterium]
MNGGAELHCRWHAEALAARHEVEVFATRAIDYVEWPNDYPEGTALVNGVPVHRYSVRRRRVMRDFASISNVVFGDRHTREEEERWVRENGPFAPALVEAVARARHRFDLFIFYCYRYWQTYHGLPRVADRAVLVPTAEEDPAIGLGIFREFFRRPRGLVYLTPEERDLVETAAGGTGRPDAVIGSGLSLPAAAVAPDFRERFRLVRPFLLYVGRIERNKGCGTLFTYFRRFLDETGADLDLVLAGKPAMAIPDHPRIRPIGFISEDDKVAALRHALALVMPSPYESLSVIALEAWKLELPVLANGRCAPLKGQCLRSNGGLFYDGYDEFESGLRLLLERPELRRALGRQGREYVEREYSWDRVLGKLEDLFQRVRA